MLSTYKGELNVDLIKQNFMSSLSTMNLPWFNIIKDPTLLLIVVNFPKSSSLLLHYRIWFTVYSTCDTVM